MDRLIDQIQLEIRNKDILSKISHIVLSKESLEVLYDDFKEEFAIEYSELGRTPSRRDLERLFEYFYNYTTTGWRRRILLTY